MLDITKKYDGHEFALAVLVGSHNYNLNTEGSDKDYKYFVWPTIDDLLDGKKYHHESISAKEDFTIHDIRNLPSLFWKGNLNFLEILFSIEMVGNAKLISYLDAHKKDLTMGNIKRVFDACMGMSFEKEKLMLKDSPGRHESIEKFGFDTKSAHHAIRVLNFLMRFYMSHGDFKSAIWYDNLDPAKGYLLSVKRGERPLDAVKRTISTSRAMLEPFREWYSTQPVRKEVFDSCDEFIKDMIKKRIRGDE